VSTTRTSDRYEPLLGTVVEIDLELDGVGREPEADAFSSAIVDEMVRLQSILSSVDPDSEFSRWCRGEQSDTSPELLTVLALAADWQRRSRGRFTPAAGRLTRLWRAAELDGCEPDPAELATVVADIGEPRWSVVDGVAVRLVDTTDCTLNALAKGWIADRALAIAMAAEGVVSATINAGGDLVTGGRSERRIGIEDPATAWDNAPPLTTIVLRDAGLATSGGARRGFNIDGVLHSHVLDPRTGRPVDDVASISVVAPTAAEADVLATVLGVEPAVDALAEATALGLACLMVTADGQVLATEGWRRLEIS
jgi:thiamine biosynthesis lipoprotein